MCAYQPYLLPLFIDPGDLEEQTIDSPIDEERMIRRKTGKHTPGWDRLSILVQEAYGLPFITDVRIDLSSRDFEIRKRSIPSGDAPEEGYRFLQARIGKESWFVLEHPAGLSLFDHFGSDSEVAVLARPTLFAEMWLQVGHDRSPGQEIPHPFNQSSQHALYSHLDELVRTYRPSDWHLEPRENSFRSRLRIDGRLCKEESLSRERAGWLIHSIRRACNIPDDPIRREHSGSMELKTGEGRTVSIRISIIPSLHGEAVVSRFLYPSNPSQSRLEDLGFTREQSQLIHHLYESPEGLWIVAGPTGSGKTTTLHTLVKWSVDRNEKILTAEDPVERIIPGAQQVEIGKQTGMTYAIAIRAFLRQSPDTLLVGEIRDEETAAMALQAARTGHRVLSSLHARSPQGILRRLEDLGQSPVDLGNVIRAVMMQKLVPLLCSSCHRRFPMPVTWKDALLPFVNDMPRECSIATSGCHACHSGYLGRTAVCWCSPWKTVDPCAFPFFASAWALFNQGRIAMEDLLPFAPAVIQRHLRFAKRKDSVKTHLISDPNCL